MAFLIKAELKTVSDLAVVDIITNLDDTIITEIIAESISVMKGLLSRNYNAELIFSKTSDERDLTVLKYLKAIVIYEIYLRYTREINEAAAKRYEEAMLWLEQLNTGKLFIGTLPPIAGELPNTQNGQDTRFGGDYRYNNMY